MARTLQARVSGTWQPTKLANVKVAGVWKAWKTAWVRVAGTWKQFYPAVDDATVALETTTPGSHPQVVPMGITRMRITIAGGGGSGTTLIGVGGDFFAGGGGGSGGYRQNEDKAVTPGETISVTVGAGGAASSYSLPGFAGSAGGLTTISGGFGSSTATGGSGGTWNPGPGVGGAGGVLRPGIPPDLPEFGGALLRDGDDAGQASVG